ncbi:MAG: XdhC/CoxI family protein [Prolixibacteraceae bacterium]|nr:XdhC/CoxI family protein [Prolixibacteraceae bacterium]
MSSSICIYPELVALLRQQTECILATVISTQGSTPQKSGSSALIGTGGLLAGTVGGGVTELKVIQQSQFLLKTKKSGLFSYELHGEIFKGSESICGGNMTILLDATPDLHLPVFYQLKNSLDRRQKGVLLTLTDATDLSNVKIVRQWIVEEELNFDQKMQDNIRPVISEMFRNNHSEAIQAIPFDENRTLAKGFSLMERIHPKPSLIIAGAGHIGHSLAHLGKFLGFDVTVWDDRPEYANQNLFPDADVVLSGTVDESIGQLPIRDDSYLVIVTRGHKSDAGVLRKFIGSNAAYIGMIGSKAKVAQMKALFLENTWATPEQWSRIYTPVGLDIGAQTVEEIAISIAAQLVKVKNQKSASHE